MYHENVILCHIIPCHQRNAIGYVNWNGVNNVCVPLCSLSISLQNLIIWCFGEVSMIGPVLNVSMICRSAEVSQRHRRLFGKLLLRHDSCWFFPVKQKRSLCLQGFPISSIHLCPLLGRNRANFKLQQAIAESWLVGRFVGDGIGWSFSRWIHTKNGGAKRLFK